MIGRFRSALYSAIGQLDGGDAANGVGVPADGPGGGDPAGGADRQAQKRDSRAGGPVGSAAPGLRVKYPYQRPLFLQLFTDDEIQATADHLVRPIIVPRDLAFLPWCAGYAEAINAGKSLRNEDQAAFHRGVLRTCDIDDAVEVAEDCEVPYVYFGVFDGHAGSGCAVAAANELHQVLHKRLMAVLHHLVPEANVKGAGTSQAMWFPSRDISTDSLIIGALEAAFWEMDAQIGEDKRRYKMLGGCTVLVSLFILGKLYVANAGDSRGVLCRNSVAYPMSFDFTPVSERQRLQQLGYQKPQLLGSEYTHLDYCRRPMRKDVGKKMLYRDAHMTGWSYKEITQDDLKFPVVYGEGKRSRLLATIGVTRGFGDHDLRAQSQNGHILIKPFLTPQPEVRVLDVEGEDVSEADALVMATDGLWDVVSNEKVAEVVDAGLAAYEDADEARRRYRFVTIAQDLVMAARGKLVDRNWKRSAAAAGNSASSASAGGEMLAATIDDISVMVIPILAYKREYAEWKAKVADRRKNKRMQEQEAPAVLNMDSSAASSHSNYTTAHSHQDFATSSGGDSSPEFEEAVEAAENGGHDNDAEDACPEEMDGAELLASKQGKSSRDETEDKSEEEEEIAGQK